ncbi:hypothetical protein Tco_0630338 [Tanacetum coccineum]
MGRARSVLYVIMSLQSSSCGRSQEVAVTRLKPHKLLNPRILVTTAISQEYLLEFSSEYYIPENLHPELPGPGDHIVDFPEGNQPLLLGGREGVPIIVAWRMAATKDDKPKANTYSVEDVATLDTHQMDLFNLIKAPNTTKVKTGTRQRTAHEVPLLKATASHVIQMVDATEPSTSSGTPSTVERSSLDFSNEDAPLPVTQGAEAVVHEPTAAEQEIPVTDDVEATKAAVEPDLEKEVISIGPTIKKRRRQRDAGEGGSNAPSKVLRKDHDVARAEHNAHEGKSLADMSVDTEPAIHDLLKRQEARETRTPKTLHLLLLLPGPQEASTNWDGAEANGYGLSAEVEIRVGGQTIEDIRNPAEVKSSEVSVLQDRVMGKERIMAAFEVFKKHEDERVIGHGLRLAVMKCAESTELRQAFANVVPAGIAKGMSKELKYGVEHRKAGLELTALDVIMASLYMDINTGEIKILVYLEVRSPRNPWAYKEEILLENAITANKSRAEKKKKSRVVCCTHGVGSAHHARSDGIPVSVPTIAPQGLQILPADAATQTEDEESPRLLRSKSLPPIFNLDWP